MGGSSPSPPPPPEPLDPGKAMGEYMFGQGFTNYQGVTDPRLQERLIGAEQRFRPQYAALELADINTFATGIPGGRDNPQYKRLEAKLAGLEAGEGGISNEEAMKIARSAAGPAPSETKFIPASTYARGGRHPRSKDRTVKNPNYEKELAEYNREVQQIANSLGGNRASQIASIKAEMAQLESSPGQRGLFDLLEEQSTRAGALQREQLQLQREADVGALQEFAPQVVEAYRAADPASTAIAERMSRRALGQLTPEEERNIQQRSRQASLARGRIGDSSSLAAEALGRSDYTAQFAQPAFAMNRQIAGDIGSTLLGRPSAAIGLGGQVLGQAQQGAAGPMGPQLFDPNMGINMALQQRSQDINYQGAMAQAGAARSAGRAGMFGSILGGAASAIPFCWVAREVYGIENPKWLEFRYWMLNDAPSWFRNLYIKYGERIAKFISNKPRIKSIIRKWMNTKIK
jgi:hypothetical protein